MHLRDRPDRRAGFAALIVAGVVGLVGCGSPVASRTPPTSPAATAAGTAPGPPTVAASASAAGGPSSVPGSGRIALQKVAGGFDQPVFVTHAGDGSGRLFVVEQPGRIRVVRDGTVLATPFLDIGGQLSCCGERGLLGLAFAPGFGRTSEAFFVDYTDANGDTVIARGTAGQGDDVDHAQGGTVSPLLHIGQPFPNHNGGMLAFGPDGDLYVGMGDGGSGGDPQGNGQRLDTLLGKILRLDVTSDPGSATALAPASNPFVGRAGARPEIWAYGMRNPWRFSFDRATGDLWVGDVGQDRWEEVDVARAADGGERGLDFGWNRMEGTHCFGAIFGCDQAGLTLPVAEYDHAAGDCAVIGGYVYRGSAVPGLAGTYLFGDECSGTIRALDAARPADQAPRVVLETGRAISSFGEDEAGELYLTDLASGDLLRVAAAP